MPARHRAPSERGQLDLFRALPGAIAPRDAQDLMAYPFFSLAKTPRVAPIDFAAGGVSIRVEAVPETAAMRGEYEPALFESMVGRHAVFGAILRSGRLVRAIDADAEAAR